MQARPGSQAHPTNCSHCSPERKRTRSNARFILAFFAQSGVRAQHPACGQRPKKYQSHDVRDRCESA
jgi:hypothetical protein